MSQGFDDRSSLSHEQETEPILACVRKLAEEVKDEYRWDQGVLVQEEKDELGDIVRKVVLPKEHEKLGFDVGS